MIHTVAKIKDIPALSVLEQPPATCEITAAQILAAIKPLHPAPTARALPAFTTATNDRKPVANRERRRHPMAAAAGAPTAPATVHPARR